MKITLSKDKYSIESDGKNRAYRINRVLVNLSETPVQLINVASVREFLTKALDSLYEIEDDISIQQDLEGGSIKITCHDADIWIEGTFTYHKIQFKESYEDWRADEDIIDSYCESLECKNRSFNQKISQKAQSIFEELNEQMNHVEEAFNEH